MEDNQIIDLYFSRDQQAISATEEKYGPYCRTVAYNILQDDADAEECVNDTYLRAWEAMPPQRPARLAAFLAKITRNLSFNRIERNSAKKRGGGEVPLALLELEECLPSGESVEEAVEERLLTEALETFLRSQPPLQRQIFLLRYWHLFPIRAIARHMAMGESRVKIMLHRTRLSLRDYLEQEGILL